MEMHPYFTEVPNRSFEAIVQNGWLSELLLALVTDPTDPYEIADTLVRKSLHELVIQPPFENERPYPAPIALRNFVELGADAVDAMKRTAAQWVMTTERANEALRVLTMWDRRFGVWCACQVAREALRFVPKGEQRPLRAIETAEAWVVGRATLDAVRRAAYAAYAADAYAADADAAAYAAYAADAYAADADAASVAAYAAYAYAASVAYDAAAYAYAASVADDAAAAAYAAAYGSPEWSRVRDEELIRLREVVANACLTFPM